MRKTKISFIVISLLLACAMVVNLTGCSAKARAADLMAGIKPNTAAGKAADDVFIASQMRLALDLFRSSAAESKNKNVLISPLSIQLALAMTANGANGKTREEMENLLGGNFSVEELNEYLCSYVKNLPSQEKYKLKIANSIWFRDDKAALTVEKNFLQTNADYYGAQAYRVPFDHQTQKDINGWVSAHTDGMIDKMIGEINPDAVMYLINALAFDAEWETSYQKANVHQGTFTDISGQEQSVEMMYSDEYQYLDDANATGFIKNYKGGKYSFAALLPNEGVDIYEYIAGFTDESLLNTLKNAQEEAVTATLPKFKCEYELSMNDVLSGLGMPSAFDSKTADFSGLGKSSDGNIYIGDVLHKTLISVDELGTKAGAATKVEMQAGACLIEKEVVLNRPFVYMIIDNTAKLPVFIGAVMDMEK